MTYNIGVIISPTDVDRVNFGVNFPGIPFVSRFLNNFIVGAGEFAVMLLAETITVAREESGSRSVLEAKEGLGESPVVGVSMTSNI